MKYQCSQQHYPQRPKGRRNQVFVDSCTERQNMLNTQNGVLSSLKNQSKSATGYNMDETCGHYAKRNKSQKGKYHIIPLI